MACNWASRKSKGTDVHGIPKIRGVKLGRPNSEINVTPLVDVVLVLLIIFMVVTPLLEKEIEVKVPTNEQVPEQIEVPQDQIVIQLNAKGDISLNTRPIADQSLVDELQKALQGKASGEKLIFISADEKANYGKLVSILDRAKQAGAETLGMMTDALPPAGQAGPATPPRPARRK